MNGSRVKKLVRDYINLAGHAPKKTVRRALKLAWALQNAGTQAGSEPSPLREPSRHRLKNQRKPMLSFGWLKAIRRRKKLRRV